MYSNDHEIKERQNSTSFMEGTLGAIFILHKDIGVGGWSKKWQFFLTLCSERVLT